MDNNERLFEAANFIHNYCRDHDCENCPFLTQNDACRINDIPDTWYIPEILK